MQGRDTSPGAEETSKTVLRKFPRKSNDVLKIPDGHMDLKVRKDVMFRCFCADNIFCELCKKNGGFYKIIIKNA